MKEGFLRLFTYIREHQEFFQNYINLSRRRNHQAKILPDILENSLDRIVRGLGYRSEEELLYHQTFFTGGLMALISRWMDKGCLEEPEKLYRLIEEEYTM